MSVKAVGRTSEFSDLPRLTENPALDFTKIQL